MNIILLIFYSLQKFKMNIASSVINKDNASISTMDSDQILEIFNVSSANANDKDAKDKKLNSREVLQNLEELWDEEQYEDFEVTEYMKTMRK